jgi:phosphatidylserine decarboxylase
VDPAPLLFSAVALSIERVAYVAIWRRPDAFRALCVRARLGAPVVALQRLFYAFKALQALVFAAWIAHHGGLAASGSGALALGASLLVLGQMLNVAVFHRLGRIGVFYGARFGHAVPWVRAFPFSVFAHPQYVGTVASIWGLFLATRFPHGDWIALPLLETLYYAIGARLEREPARSVAFPGRIGEVSASFRESGAPLIASARARADAPSRIQPPGGGGRMIARLFQQEDLNFLLTNRIPRRAATRLLGWLSRLEIPLLVRVSLRIWKLLAPDLDLSEARTRHFRSLRDCFIRELAPGARPVVADPGVVVSPCDAVVGPCGPVDGELVIQAKGLPYRLAELLGDESLVARHRDGRFVTLRLKSTMYHRFHAPAACRLHEVTHISGDTWNVNPIALSRVERLFCRNERAVLPLELEDVDGALTLVPVAAIGVASLRLHCVGDTLDLDYAGPTRIPCAARYDKGQELGWFEQGSTIIVLASGDLALADGVREGSLVRMGEPLLTTSNARHPAGA